MPPVRRDNSAPPAPPPDAEGDQPADTTTDPVTGARITRPRNAWILYRRDKMADLEATEGKLTMSEVSKRISHIWHNEAPEVRAHYEELAEREKAEHAARFPTYRFAPKSKAQKEAEKAKRKATRAAKGNKRKRAQGASMAAARNVSATYYTSTQVPYYTAAMLNQGTAVACAPEGPSPPLSLANTPISTPSPFQLSEFEQGSSSTANTSPQASPAGPSGLGLIQQPMKFDGQEQANARIPKHKPARLPSRPRAKKELQRDPPAASATALSPAPPAMDAALSPLPWELQPAQPQPEFQQSGPSSSHPNSRIPSPNALLQPSGDELGTWPTNELYAPEELDFNYDPLHMGYPMQNGANFGDFDFGGLLAPGFDAVNTDGIYQLNAAPGVFNGDEAPASIEVQLGKDGDGQFDLNSFLNAISPTEDVVRSEAQTFNFLDMSADFGHSHEVPSSTALMANTLPTLYESAEMNQPVAGPSQPPDYMEGIVETPQHAVQQPQAEDDFIDPSIPEHFRNDPFFRQICGPYFAAQKAKERHQSAQGHAELLYPAEAQPEHEVPAHRSFSEQYSLYTIQESSQPIQDSRPSASTATTYVPPSGAANSHIRRVGGAWRPPVPQAPDSAPQTPAQYTRIMSWGSVASA